MSEANEAARRRPLYQQVHDRLVALIASGEWGPGQPIPPEAEIARQFRVAPGTARAAVSALVSEKLVVRRHGRGTFVYEYTPEDEAARFLRLVDNERKPINPVERMDRPTRGVANQTECRELALTAASRVFRIKRLRERNGIPFALERITLPEALFPGLGERDKLRDTRYELYQSHYRVLVVEVEDRLCAVAADSNAARELKIAVGTPLVRIERVAFGLGAKPVEWRVSLCHLTDARYVARLK
jgi:GntR family transcriptional regulator